MRFLIFMSLMGFHVVAGAANPQVIFLRRESPVTEVEADYLCQIQNSDNIVGLKIPSATQAPRMWLTATETPTGLEPFIEEFTFVGCENACEFNYKVKAIYSFFGSTNRITFTTEAKDAKKMIKYQEWDEAGKRLIFEGAGECTPPPPPIPEAN